MVNIHANNKTKTKTKTKTAIKRFGGGEDVMPASPKKKSAGKKYYSNLKNYKGTAYGVNPDSKSYRQKLADKKEKTFRADTRDAAKSGQTMKQLKTSGKLSNLKVNLNKAKKTIERIIRGRK